MNFCPYSSVQITDILKHRLQRVRVFAIVIIVVIYLPFLYTRYLLVTMEIFVIFVLRSPPCGAQIIPLVARDVD